MAFDPTKDVRFRGKLIYELEPDELREALIQALKEVARLKASVGEYVPGR